MYTSYYFWYHYSLKNRFLGKKIKTELKQGCCVGVKRARVEIPVMRMGCRDKQD